MLSPDFYKVDERSPIHGDKDNQTKDLEIEFVDRTRICCGWFFLERSWKLP